MIEIIDQIVAGSAKSSSGGGQIINNEDLTITANGIYTASEGYTGIGTATVNVPAGSSQKYGATVNNFLGDVNANGVLQFANTLSELVFGGVKDVNRKALQYKFYEYGDSSDNITVSFPDLEQVSGYMACYSLLMGSMGLKKLYFPKLETISGEQSFSQLAYSSYGYNYLNTVEIPKLKTISGTAGMYGTFRGCSVLTEMPLTALETVSGQRGLQNCFDSTRFTTLNFQSLKTLSGRQALSFCFYKNTHLTTATFPVLSDVTGEYCLTQCFQNCTSLTSISFPALKSDSFGSYTNQFSSMLNSVTGCTVHFPSNLQSVIGSWSDVTNGFGGTNTTVLYDLPATE